MGRVMSEGLRRREEKPEWGCPLAFPSHCFPVPDGVPLVHNSCDTLAWLCSYSCWLSNGHFLLINWFPDALDLRFTCPGGRGGSSASLSPPISDPPKQILSVANHTFPFSDSQSSVLLYWMGPHLFKPPPPLSLREWLWTFLFTIWPIF